MIICEDKRWGFNTLHMGIHVSEEKERIVKANQKILYVCTFRGYEKIREVDNGSNQKIPNISYYGVLFGIFSISTSILMDVLIPQCTGDYFIRGQATFF